MVRVIGILIVAIALPAAAQGEEGDADTSADDDDVDVVIVTGTRLKGVDPASPRITITSEQIERGGYASIED
ncbi:MAG: hypothetical protein OXP36_08505, partial [Gammaproteobacteria bacterium]|nr:hypothetical protein [Gammaproteobacteria bacterium]